MTTNDIKTLIPSDESRTLKLKKVTGELKDEIQDLLHSTESYRIERTVSTGNMDKFWRLFVLLPTTCQTLARKDFCL